MKGEERRAGAKARARMKGKSKSRCIVKGRGDCRGRGAKGDLGLAFVGFEFG